MKILLGGILFVIAVAVSVVFMVSVSIYLHFSP